MVFALLLVLALIESGPPSVLAETGCTLDGRKYAVGETWHPVLRPLGTTPCINCTCEQTGKTNCVTEKCPRPKCETPIIVPGKCCLTCQDPFDNIPPTVQTSDGSGKDTDNPGCRFDGEIYEDGTMFPSNRTGLKATRNDQCVMCFCQTAQVLCHLKTCEKKESCKKYINVSDDCCPHCEEEDDYEDYVNKILSGERPDNVSDSDCTAGKTNGKTWHPLIGTYGPDKCVLCKCKEGSVSCKRKECVPDKKLPCSSPVQKEGECCKTCPKRTRVTDRGRNCRRRKGKDVKRRRRRCNKKGGRKRKKHKQSTPSTTTRVIPTSLPPTTPPPSLFSTMCLPKRGDRYVYQIEEKHSITLMFDVPTGNSVEVLKWTVRKGRVSEMMTENRPAAAVRATISQSQVLGATNKRNFKKFKRKLRKKTQRCEPSCRRRVVTSCLKRLKTKSAKFGKQCDKN
ncbi:chordin-like protein 1 isoform X1 [Haliotis rufescens]|uniref:chordin-like protein 1 isoform X1 n=1 Tax=Haliotis rufescens TaxID=6454 RepID=UPI00201ED990|nr:chordin-like protein 1 isoform X1 [Haliotis rufescens]